MKNIIVPVDFSLNATNALNYAVEIAKQFRANILVYHSYPVIIPMSVQPGSSYPYIEETLEQNNINAQKHLDEYVTKFKKNNDLGNIKMSTLLENGEVTNNLISLGKKESRYSMIIMGTKGASGIEEVVFGTITAEILREVTIPVLVVPENAKFEGINAITFATGFDLRDIKTINELLRIGGRLNASLTCLHINTNQEKLFYEDSEKFELETIFKYTPLSRLNFELKKGEEVEKSLKEYLEHSKTDLLAIRPKHYGFIESLFHSSLTQKLAYHTNVPLLVLK